MNFIVSANTDVGIVKSTNQDSLTAMTFTTPQGPMAMAVLCDGMGGLSKGELASATVIQEFRRWAYNELPLLASEPISDDVIRSQWSDIIHEQNEKIKTYGTSQGVRLGTTVVAILLTQSRYYILNVGDSRAYEILDDVRQLTEDQTFVAREVAMGRMTPEEAERDSRSSVLLQCVGASESVYPDLFFGETRQDAVYMLCSDGFRHKISAEEIYEKLQPGVLYDDETMHRNTACLIDVDKSRQERDNISALLIRTF